MQSTEACVDHVKLSLYANTAVVNRVKSVKCAVSLNRRIN